ncbi:hypothetical protein M409DRAFT_71693 [Zasmidium cellare ATCC 36951]|uniref:Uncharacterized protein n=1 Tax=Zasmidium cellare ATCC 36951 TaxID=1080233 RepID=A0A6A6BWI3_ZASCE|nr:uncharacterized protein M409DRAFT_71693 [Zasmidium cellare ATCC 36951]KAF2158330.1 hypothetical protein M409DRAFT_71693 [Zasmidium cellare ATCC 36951]
MGRLQREDTGWVDEHLPDWRNAIYTVDNTSYPLSTPHNKGREANAYLLYIIQHYDRLPAIIAFLHSHRDGYPVGWHTDVPGYDNVLAMQTLRIDAVKHYGYVNLRCNWIPGCPDEVRPLSSAHNNPNNVQCQMPLVWRHFFGELSDVPDVIATPCCAQFVVSREQVWKRPLEDYKRYHQWLMDTSLNDDISGRILEYLWHIIFGMDPVHCPDMNQCYRDVYGR